MVTDNTFAAHRQNINCCKTHVTSSSY